MTKSFYSLISVLFILLTACGNDPNPAGLVLEMKAVPGTSPVNGRKSAAPQFSKFMVGLTKLELETENENEKEREKGEEDLDDEIEFKGPFRVNLLTGESAPDFGRAITMPGVYDEIEFKLGPVLEGGKTIEIAFSLDGKQFEISSEVDELEIELEQQGGFQVNENTLSTLLVLIDLNILFSNVDFSLATPDDDGIYRINEQSNSDLLESILSSFDDSCEGGKDDDKDEKLDDKEDEDENGDD